MEVKDSQFFEKGFDEGTLTKLYIFEKYIEEWIPVFIYSCPASHKLQIYDFFAGPGYDVNGVSGSPIRILKTVAKYYEDITKANKKVDILLNDDSATYHSQLRDNCEAYLESNAHLKQVVQLILYNEKVEKLLPAVISSIGDSPSLVLMDQFGVKHVPYIEEFSKCDKTDFIYFISSSSAKRFAETIGIQKALNPTEQQTESLLRCPHKLIHDSIVNLLREKVKKSNLALYPFSLKKGSNIYGLIFGAQHPLAIDKFLRIAWKISPENGCADYDINEDVKKKAPVLWEEARQLTTIELFKESLEKAVMNGDVANNVDAYYFALSWGHIPSHATEVLKSLKKEGKIHYEKKSPLINYDNAVKDQQVVQFDIKGKGNFKQ